jgi:ComF family protein
VLEVLLWLVFPRACIGCDRDGALLCEGCAPTGGSPRRVVLGDLEVRSCVAYAGAVRSAIGEFKRGRRALAGDLARLIAPAVDPSMTLVPVPTTRRRRLERGFDQTRLLARLLRRRTGANVCELLQPRGAAAQQGRSRAQRLAAAGRFRVRPGVSVPPGKLVLFDDVRTTGATLVDAAGTLRDAGFRVEGALTLAWTPKESA